MRDTLAKKYSSPCLRDEQGLLLFVGGMSLGFLAMAPCPDGAYGEYYASYNQNICQLQWYQAVGWCN